mmetsp:Transcript_2590/g.2564  ORF Transcript_2590/g.2564 Transcript_2590/m.2564 type:complete len:334 (-) Transcript_2590:125-1126(-)
MGCCQSQMDDTKRHPLLRSSQQDSLSSPSQRKSVDSSSTKGIAIHTISNLEYRARLDAIRGPPVSLVAKLPDLGELKGDQKPVLIRSNIKNGVRIENLQIPQNYPRHLWLSTHMTDFADHIRVFNKNVLVAKCTRYRCPRMYERKNIAYVWTYDDEGNPSKSIKRKLSAPDYIVKVIHINATLLKRIQLIETVDNADEVDVEQHELLCKTIAHLICQVYCHILYWHHDAFAQLEALPHLNTCFKWFIFFCKQFRLLDDTDLEPLQDLLARIYEIDLMQSNGNGNESDQDEVKRGSSVSSSIYSDDVSKLTTPTIDYQGDRLLSEHSIDLSGNR